MSYFMSTLASLASLTTATESAGCQLPDEPIIDVHIHAYGDDPRMLSRELNPFSGKPSEATDGASHTALTLRELKRLGVVRAITSGENFDAAAAMVEADPSRVRLGYEVDAIPTAEDLERIRNLHSEGRIELIGEIAPQYVGVAPNDPRLDDFWALSEELGLPVGYHMGSGPRNIVYSAFPMHRAALGDPLLLEEVLVKHPNLKIFIMHGGFPFADNMRALMSAYPAVYMDLGAISFYENRRAFHEYLRQMMEAGFGKRIMFGSDQMVWPEAIEQSLKAYEEASFLTEDERRDIFFNNAVRFFGWDDLADC